MSGNVLNERETTFVFPLPVYYYAALSIRIMLVFLLFLSFSASLLNILLIGFFQVKTFNVNLFERALEN